MPAYRFFQWQNVVSLTPSLRQSSATARPCSAWRRVWAICWSVYRGFFMPVLLAQEDRILNVLP